MAVRGWRSSWASADAISPMSLTREVWSSSACSSSRRLASMIRSLMSRADFDAPITTPLGSKIGETVRETWTGLPSLCRRTVS